MPRRLAALLALALILSPAAYADDGPPTVAEALSFVEEAEARLVELLAENERAAWVQANFITTDTEAIAAVAQAKLLQATAELSARAARYRDLELPADAARKLTILRVKAALAAPNDPVQAKELAVLARQLISAYGSGKYCPEEGECLNLGQLSKIMAKSRDADELLEAWKGWRTISPPMRAKYERFAELGNAGAQQLGFADTGAMWRSAYDMPAEDFAVELDRLWGQVAPLYESLHCYVRAKLRDHYGAELVPADGPIPAHLLGNMWAQSWGNVFDLVAPPGGEGVDVTKLLAAKQVDALGMVRYGEGFFTSLGLDPLPETFWERSLFTKPQDRDVVCHASAWAVDWKDDLRIKMCIEINEEDFVTVHHELGHIFYYQRYAALDPFYRSGANDGFHEAIGDTVALSVTPAYLKQAGLLDAIPADESPLPQLMRAALEKIAFLPFGLVVDQWRFKVFAGEFPPERYNAGWWELRTKYQGVAAPATRSEADFDPGAKNHIPGNTPYTRYFLAHILQFQFHRELCKAAGHEGPLHTCSIYGNEEAGRRLRAVLDMGASRPWPDALEALTGQREMDASAVLEYFAPLKEWLDGENEGRTCGW